MSVWVNDQRIRNAQISLMRAGFPTKIQILGKRKFAMVISLKKLRNTVKEHLGSYYKYIIYDASKPLKPRLGIKAIGNFAGLKMEELYPMVQKLNNAGFKTEIGLNEGMTEITIVIDLAPIQDVFTASGIPKRLFTEKLKVERDIPLLIITFGR